MRSPPASAISSIPFAGGALAGRPRPPGGFHGAGRGSGSSSSSLAPLPPFPAFLVPSLPRLFGAAAAQLQQREWQRLGQLPFPARLRVPALLRAGSCSFACSRTGPRFPVPSLPRLAGAAAASFSWGVEPARAASCSRPPTPRSRLNAAVLSDCFDCDRMRSRRFRGGRSGPSPATSPDIQLPRQGLRCCASK